MLDAAGCGSVVAGVVAVVVAPTNKLYKLLSKIYATSATSYVDTLACGELETEECRVYFPSRAHARVYRGEVVAPSGIRSRSAIQPPQPPCHKLWHPSALAPDRHQLGPTGEPGRHLAPGPKVDKVDTPTRAGEGAHAAGVSDETPCSGGARIGEPTRARA